MFDTFEKYIFCGKILYEIVASNNKIANAFSLKNIFNKQFLRHKDGHIIESHKEKHDCFFDDDSSFFVEREANLIYLRCTNVNLTDHYIAKTNDIFVIDKAKRYGFVFASNLKSNSLICLDNSLYISCKPNNNIAECCSFKLINSHCFLRHRDGNIINSIIKQNDIFFDDDSSFVCLTDSNYVVIFCSNNNLQGYYIAKTDTSRYYISNTENYEIFDIIATQKHIEACIENQENIFYKNYKKDIDITQKVAENFAIAEQKIFNSLNAYKSILFEYLKTSNNNRLDILAEKQKSCENCSISIIVPVYNMEQYIRDCLDSIISQTLQNIEIIIIDDGSTDTSYDIIKEYTDQDSRIIVLRQENQGVGVARNLGIHSASGEYISFIDPDDIYPCNDTLENLYTCAKLFNVKIAGGEFAFFTNQSKKLSQPFGIGYEGYKFKNAGLVEYIDYQFDYGFHRFIYSREFLNDYSICFPNYKRFQDPPFFVTALHKAQYFFALKSITYGYRIGHKKTKWTEEIIDDFIYGISDVIDCAITNSYKKLLLYSFFHLCDHFNEFRACSTHKNREHLLQLIDRFDKNYINSKTKQECFEKFVSDILSIK